ncbi:type I polyketide synthase [Thioflexithrix psekupsensis]|uniref:Uncharacterized protein n=1 Tax=Thioflexithrix psekupsensis TaxID=1570016 RepID=A0A251XA48_9GAMM|nr:type I polyketide synthase [Thioflexithrix psekupsensis]OUD15249.1 hypothetical protein TPSD3_01585 [Thioflexithrix psekupsensis]
MGRPPPTCYPHRSRCPASRRMTLENRHIESLKRAYKAIEQLEQRLQQHAQNTEPVAIVGYACRFPGGANHPQAYWELLQQGIDAISEVPADRWNVDDYYHPDRSLQGKINTRCSGFLDHDVYAFEPQFFGIAPKEALQLDPQQRLLLEITWEALEHANIIPDQLFGSATGVFIGISSVDYAIRQLGMLPAHEIGAYVGTGALLSPAAGRISYVLGLTGPSTIVDTACSSSLLSVHLGCQSLRSRESNMVIAGGVNLILAPEVSTYFSTAGMLSSDGRCKTFDQRADGYVRSEGCGIVLLKRLSDALNDGDVIHAVIRASAVNQDGPSGGLTVPSGPSQQQVIRQALERGKINPADIDYIEAHGTGTPLGDPIEVGSLAQVFAANHNAQHPLIIGSVKTNIGHLEAAAGVAGLIKLLLALKHQQIPQHLHFTQGNPRVDWDSLPFKIPVKPIAWTKTADKPRLAGINSFGFSGTNAHVILGDAPNSSAIKTEEADPRSHHLLLLSAKTPAALMAMVQQYQDFLNHNSDSLADIAYTSQVGRSYFTERLALIAENKAQLQQQLAEITADHLPDFVYRSTTQKKPQIAFLFSGQGAQYINMGKTLYETQALFRQIIDDCDAQLKDILPISLLKVLYPDALAIDGESPWLDHTQYTQPALFVLEYALAKLWQAWGVQPAAVLGHSVGEYVAACIAGVFSLTDALTLIAARGRLMASLPAGGVMMTLFAPLEQVKIAVAPYEKTVSIAAINSPANIVISGAAKEVQTIADYCQQQGIKTRALTVSHAFHSPLMQPILSEFKEIIAKVTLSPPQLPLVSNLTGKIVTNEVTHPDYWCEHLRHTVQFAPSLHYLRDELNINAFLEIGPRPALTAMAQQTLGEEGLLWLNSLRHGHSDWQQMLNAAGQLLVSGWRLDGAAVAQGHSVRRVTLPTYPFQRKRYCIERPRTAALSRLHPLIDRHSPLPTQHAHLFETNFHIDALPILQDHRVYQHVVVSGASHLSFILGAFTHLLAKSGNFDNTNPTSCVLSDVFFQHALVIPSQGRTVQLWVEEQLPRKQANYHLISFDPAHPSDPTTHVTGQWSADIMPPHYTELNLAQLHQIKSRCPQVFTPEQVYQIQAQRHIDLGVNYQWVQQIWRGEREALCEIKVPAALATEIAGYQLHPGLLDACFGLLAVSVDLAVSDTFVPFGVQSLRFYQAPSEQQHLLAYAKVRSDAREGWLEGDISLFDASNGARVAEFIGFEGREARRDAFLPQSTSPLADLCYQMTWQAADLPVGLQVLDFNLWTNGVIFADQTGIGQALAQAILTSARSVDMNTIAITLVYLGTAKGIDDPAIRVLNITDPLSSDEYQAIFAQIGAKPLTSVLHLWSLDAKSDDLASTQRESVGSALLLSQIVLARADTPYLWWMTQGVFAHQTTHSVLQSSLWGFISVLHNEQPQLNSRCIDFTLIEQGLISEMVTPLMREVLTKTEDKQVQWRGTQRFIPQLTPYTPAQKTKPVAIQAHETYVITGGTGALGLACAEWLLEQGAESIVLLSRRGTTDNILSDKVRLVAVDVTDKVALYAALDQVLADLPPLAGVFHAAGTLDDGLIQNLSWPRLESVLAAKVYGAWHLHEYTTALPLRFFVLFASAASVLGNAGQSNYAAANTFLAHLAAYRQQQGMTGLSVHWGPWELGMAADLMPKLREQGIIPLEKTQALTTLGHLLSITTDLPAELMVISCDWARYLAIRGGNARFFAHFATLSRSTDTPTHSTAVTSSAAGAGELVQRLADAPAESRLNLLREYVISVTRRIIGIEANDNIDVEKPLMELGMDSLMAVDIRNALAKALNTSLPVSLLFNYPSIAELLGYLSEQFIPKETIAPTTTDKADNHTEEFAYLDDLDEASLAALIEQELGGK